MNTCDHCGKEFTPAKGNPEQRWCKPACKAANKKAQRQQRHQACAAPGCKAVFEPKRRDSRYCSKRCGWRARRMRARLTPLLRNCGICGKEFVPKPNEKYCGQACRTEAKNLSAERYRQTEKGRATRALCQERWRKENPDYAAAHFRAAYRRNPEKYRKRSREAKRRKESA